MRADDIDEAAALLQKNKQKKHLAGKISAIDIAKATAELAEAAAQIRAIQQLKKRAKSK